MMGHSMGGLLAADAATDPSNMHHRIIGMIAFDTPYLGMHPHVVISGIASLFPKDDDKEKGKPTEHDMNKDHVEMVDQGVTDDWQNYKKNMKSTTSCQSVSISAHCFRMQSLKDINHLLLSLTGHLHLLQLQSIHSPPLEAPSIPHSW